VNFLEDKDGEGNPVNAGAMAEHMRHDMVRRQLEQYKKSLDEGLITQEQFESIRDTLLRRAGLVPE
jgi:hypothetical protein